MPEPGTFLAQPFGGEGLSQQLPVRGVNPAAGSSFALPIDSAFVWRLVACTFTLTTSAVAASRYVTVQALGGDGNPFAVSGAGVTVLASSTQRFSGSVHRGMSEWAAGTDIFFPLHGLFLHGGDTLTINVAAIDAGDTLTLIYLTFDRFLESYPER